MKKYFILMLLAFVIVFGQDSLAQRRRGYEGPPMQRPERLEKFRKLRLIEVLKLNEEDAVRFFAKQSAHEEKMHTFMQKRNEVLNNIEDIIKEKGDVKGIDKFVDEISGIDKDIFAERQRYHDEVRKFLTAEQFGKFLIFERDFGRQVRDAIEEMRMDKPEPPPKD